MGFISDLGKGFVRSAVNQVGRDGGKVISNTLYGDAHATPIRKVGSSDTSVSGTDELEVASDPYQIRQEAEEQGYKVSLYRYSIITVILWSTLIILVTTVLYPYSVFVLLGFLLYSFKIPFAKSIKMRGTFFVSQYTSDRRTRTGTRYVGTQRVEKEIEVPRLAQDTSALLKKFILRIVYIIAIAIASHYCWIAINDKSTQKIETNAETGQPNNSQEILSSNTNPESE
jgi:hypothetical protein